jgi:aspartyl-tRNA(Asn)/glutamyl-tRNA(Gln) amidotransferase subunit A
MPDAFLTIAEAARLIERCELSPVSLVETLLTRVSALDPQVNAFITLCGDRALEQARQAEREIAAGRYRGPMHGIPFALKDIIETDGIRTTAHSRILKDHVPQRDATVVTKLYNAGAILLGKAATHEFAHGGPSFDLPWPPARNPWNLGRFTGGSSSGSAAAVAAGFVPAALGTDTGGSIRIPAALCGVTGLKPTFGLVSRHGVIPNSYTFDHCGPLAWTAEDCALVLQAIAGYDPSDPASSTPAVPDYRQALHDLAGIRIGVVRHFWEEDLPVAAAVSTALDAACDVLRGLGALLEPVRLRPLQEYTDVKNLISGAELFSVHQQLLIDRAQDLGAIMRSRILAFCTFQATDYVQAQRQRLRLIREIEQLYGRYDLFLTAAPGPAPPLDAHRAIGLHEKWEKPKFTAFASVTGGPAVAVCNGFDSAGMPLAFEISGRPFDDGAVLRAAHAYQRATPWRSRRPQLAAGETAPLVAAAESAAAPAAIDERLRLYLDMLAERAGLRLTQSQRGELKPHPMHWRWRTASPATMAGTMCRRVYFRSGQEEEKHDERLEGRRVRVSGHAGPGIRRSGCGASLSQQAGANDRSVRPWRRNRRRRPFDRPEAWRNVECPGRV